MKKVLALALVIVMMMAMATVAMAAFEVPAELSAEVSYAGVWPLDAGTYYPELDNRSIPAGAHVINNYLMDASYAATPLPVPAEIAGLKKVSSTADLVAGTWMLDDIGGYPYVYIMEGTAVEEPAEEVADEPAEEVDEPEVVEEAPEVVEEVPVVVEEPVVVAEPEVVAEPAPVEPAAPAATYKKPAELGAMLPFDDATAFGGPPSSTGGLWSRRTANAYDPALDNIKIPGAAFVYGATGFDIPAALAGYTKVDTGSIAAGTWAVYSYTNADYGMELSYVIVMPAEGVAVNTGDAGVMAFAAVFALAAIAMVAVLPRKKTEK